MASHKVTQTGKGTVWTGGQHRHIESLCLAEGGSVSKSKAIWNIESRLESYYTEGGGQRANVEVVQRCGRCASKYLRTDRDTTTKNNLLELPDC